jgi:molybdate transport system substrate-binding protein
MPIELRVLALQSPQIVINELAAGFERETGLKIVQLLAPEALPSHARQRIDAGEKFDAGFLEDALLEQMASEGKVIGATRQNFIRVPIGVAVKSGAPKPRIDSVAALKEAVLDAPSIAYLKGGRSGPYLERLFESWGIGAAVAAKAKRPDTDTVGEIVAAGEAALGITAIATMMATRGVDIVGRIPEAIQHYVCFAGAVSANAAAPEGAKALIDYVTGSAAQPIIQAKGMEAWADGTPAN